MTSLVEGLASGLILLAELRSRAETRHLGFEGPSHPDHLGVARQVDQDPGINICPDQVAEDDHEPRVVLPEPHHQVLGIP